MLWLLERSIFQLQSCLIQRSDYILSMSPKVFKQNKYLYSIIRKRFGPQLRYTCMRKRDRHIAATQMVWLIFCNAGRPWLISWLEDPRAGTAPSAVFSQGWKISRQRSLRVPVLWVTRSDKTENYHTYIPLHPGKIVVCICRQMYLHILCLKQLFGHPD